MTAGNIYILKLCKYKEAINQVGYINKIMKCEVM